MEAVLAVSRKRQGYVIGAVMGIAQLANMPPLYLGAESAGGALSWILAVGPLAGWGLLWIGGWLVWKLGQALFRGQGTAREVRLALGWGCIPLIWSLLFWFPLILFFWGEPMLEALVWLRFVFGAVYIWTVVTVARALAAAHGINSWAALACLVLTVSALSLPLGFILQPQP